MHDWKRSGRPSVFTDKKTEDVKEWLERSLRKSFRKLATQAQMSYSSAHTAAKKLHLQPYHIPVAQELRQQDLVKHLQFCRRFQRFVEEYEAGVL